jgi:hypothetical protein
MTHVNLLAFLDFFETLFRAYDVVAGLCSIYSASDFMGADFLRLITDRFCGLASGSHHRHHLHLCIWSIACIEKSHGSRLALWRISFVPLDMERATRDHDMYS